MIKITTYLRLYGFLELNRSQIQITTCFLSAPSQGLHNTVLHTAQPPPFFDLQSIFSPPTPPPPSLSGSVYEYLIRWKKEYAGGFDVESAVATLAFVWHLAFCCLSCRFRTGSTKCRRPYIK